MSAEGQPRPTPREGLPQQDPVQRALTRFDRQLSAPTFNPDSIAKALNSVRGAGMRAHRSPGELLASLADLSGRAAERAAEVGQDEARQVFTEQQQQFQQAAEQLAPQEGAPQSTSPSNPRRTTGRAAG